MLSLLRKGDRDRRWRSSFAKLQKEVALLEEDEYQLERVFPQVGGGGRGSGCRTCEWDWGRKRRAATSGSRHARPSNTAVVYTTSPAPVPLPLCAFSSPRFLGCSTESGRKQEGRVDVGGSRLNLHSVTVGLWASGPPMRANGR